MWCGSVWCPGGRQGREVEQVVRASKLARRRTREQGQKRIKKERKEERSSTYIDGMHEEKNPTQQTDGQLPKALCSSNIFAQTPNPDPDFPLKVSKRLRGSL